MGKLKDHYFSQLESMNRAMAELYYTELRELQDEIIALRYKQGVLLREIEDHCDNNLEDICDKCLDKLRLIRNLETEINYREIEIDKIGRVA